jgi:ribosomal protein S18 acetylase RimI-like enzyme
VVSSSGVVDVLQAQGADAVAESAAIWARAAACRDHDPEPATVEETVPGIQRRLRIDGAKLLLARRDGHAVGFAVVAPRARTLELCYLGVDPDAWGTGVGSRLLLGVVDHAREIGRETLELWVINDNERAIRVYERSGWVGTGEVKRVPSSGRLERRFLRRSGPAHAGAAEGGSDHEGADGDDGGGGEGGRHPGDQGMVRGVHAGRGVGGGAAGGRTENRDQHGQAQ